MQLLQLPWSSQSTARSSLQCCCCNFLEIANQQPEALSKAAVATTLEQSINSQKLTPMLLLQLPRSSRSTARSSLQCCCCNSLGIVDYQPEDPSYAAVSTVWKQSNQQPGATIWKQSNQQPGATARELSINSQRLPPMLLLQLPWSCRSMDRGFFQCCCCICLAAV